MYDKNYKYQSSDEIEGYKLKLYSSRLLMLFFWVVVIVMICQFLVCDDQVYIQKDLSLPIHDGSTITDHLLRVEH